MIKWYSIIVYLRPEVFFGPPVDPCLRMELMSQLKLHFPTEL